MIGIGIDVVSVSRMQEVLRRTPGFASRCFSAGERSDCEARRAPRVHYALRFAAKEAFLKALGIGVLGPVALADIEVRRDPDRLELGPSAASALGARGGAVPLLSLSFSGDAAMAMVVLH